MLRTILIFALVGPVAAGAPFVLASPFAIPYAWVIGGLPMGIAGLAFHFLQTRIWRSHSDPKEFKLLSVLPKIVLASGCAGLAVEVTCRFVTLIEPQYAEALRGLHASGFTFASAILGVILQIYLNEIVAVCLALFGGAVAGLVKLVMDRQQLREKRVVEACNG